MIILKRCLYALVILLLTGYGIVYFAYSEPDIPLNELTEKWAQSPSQFIELGGLQLHVRDEGPKDDPLPIILVHGTSASLHTWDGWTQVLATHHRIIRFDLPGFGLTGPHPNHQYRIEDYAKTLVDLMDFLAIDQAIIAGNSLGGYVAWSTAALYPKRVAKLVLVDASGYPYESDSVPIAFKISQSPLLKFLLGDIMPRNVVKSSVENVYGDPNKVSADLVDRYFELNLRAGNRQALVKRFTDTQPGQLAQKIPDLAQPTLILWGELDRLIPIDMGHRFHREIANSQFVSFGDLGHVPHEEDPQQTVEAVEQFLHSDR